MQQKKGFGHHQGSLLFAKENWRFPSSRTFVFKQQNNNVVSAGRHSNKQTNKKGLTSYCGSSDKRRVDGVGMNIAATFDEKLDNIKVAMLSKKKKKSKNVRRINNQMIKKAIIHHKPKKERPSRVDWCWRLFQPTIGQASCLLAIFECENEFLQFCT